MFIKTIFALYFTAIAIAAPQPPLNSIGSDAGEVVNNLSLNAIGGANDLVASVLGIFENAFGGPANLLKDIFGTGSTGKISLPEIQPCLQTCIPLSDRGQIRSCILDCIKHDPSR